MKTKKFLQHQSCGFQSEKKIVSLLVFVICIIRNIADNHCVQLYPIRPNNFSCSFAVRTIVFLKRSK